MNKQTLVEYFRRHPRLLFVLVFLLAIVATIALRAAAPHGAAVLYQAF